MTTGTMSMRTVAKILGVSHAYLSQIKNGKRPLPEVMKERIDALGAYHLLTTKVTTRAGGAPTNEVTSWWAGRDSNPRPVDYESTALTV
jgi:transcriptional regulator with XRE-family HTH domain